MTLLLFISVNRCFNFGIFIFLLLGITMHYQKNFFLKILNDRKYQIIRDIWNIK